MSIYLYLTVSCIDNSAKFLFYAFCKITYDAKVSVQMSYATARPGYKIEIKLIHALIGWEKLFQIICNFSVHSRR